MVAAFLGVAEHQAASSAGVLMVCGYAALIGVPGRGVRCWFTKINLGWVEARSGFTSCRGEGTAGASSLVGRCWPAAGQYRMSSAEAASHSASRQILDG